MQFPVKQGKDSHVFEAAHTHTHKCISQFLTWAETSCGVGVLV